MRNPFRARTPCERAGHWWKPPWTTAIPEYQGRFLVEMHYRVRDCERCPRQESFFLCSEVKGID